MRSLPSDIKFVKELTKKVPKSGDPGGSELPLKAHSPLDWEFLSGVSVRYRGFSDL